MISNFDELLESAAAIKGKRVVVVYPNNVETLGAVLQARARGLASFILVGDEEIISRTMVEAGGTLSGITVIHDGTDVLRVSGTTAEQIGTAAWRARLPVYELTPTHASLEEAFMQVTQDSIEYHAGATR